MLENKAKAGPPVRLLLLFEPFMELKIMQGFNLSFQPSENMK
jgi:hypothetical protein